MKVGIFATQAMEMSAPNWDSFRVQGAPNHVFFKTKKKAWTVSSFQMTWPVAKLVMY
jgi:hypothetical protein